MLTCFFDFLTTETITLLVPLVLVLIRAYNTDVLGNKKEIILFAIKSTVLWGLAYSLMFIAKWVMASIVLQTNILDLVLPKAAARIFGDIEASSMISVYIKVIKMNIYNLFPMMILKEMAWIFMILTIIILMVLFIKYRKKDISFSIILFGIAIIPYIRYFILLSHTYDHIECTYRAQLSSIIAVIVGYVYGIDLKRMITQKILYIIAISIIVIILVSSIIYIINFKKVEYKEGKIEDILYSETLITDDNGMAIDNIVFHIGESQITIPKGFSIASVNYNGGYAEILNIEKWGKYITEQRIQDEGIVVVDNNIDRFGRRNEFVWIPVNEQKYLEEFYKEDIYISQEYIEICESIKKYKGFYVARYEAGNPSKANKESSTNFYYGLTQTGKIKPVSKMGYGVWNYIPLGNKATLNNQGDGAVKISRKMYEGLNVSVKSNLIYEEQWNSILNWIEENDKYRGFSENSSEYGNYTRSLKLTGSSSNYSTKNIYDLAGNIAEWTMGVDEKLFGNVYGGGFLNSGLTAPAKYNMKKRFEGIQNMIGFRVCLYIGED